MDGGSGLGPIEIMLSGAVTAEFAFIVFLFKWILQQQADRLKASDERETGVLRAIESAIKPVPAVLETIVTTLQTILLVVNTLSREARQERHTPPPSGARGGAE